MNQPQGGGFQPGSPGGPAEKRGRHDAPMSALDMLKMEYDETQASDAMHYGPGGAWAQKHAATEAAGTGYQGYNPSHAASSNLPPYGQGMSYDRMPAGGMGNNPGSLPGFQSSDANAGFGRAGEQDMGRAQQQQQWPKAELNQPMSSQWNQFDNRKAPEPYGSQKQDGYGMSGLGSQLGVGMGGPPSSSTQQYDRGSSAAYMQSDSGMTSIKQEEDMGFGTGANQPNWSGDFKRQSDYGYGFTASTSVASKDSGSSQAGRATDASSHFGNQDYYAQWNQWSQTSSPQMPPPPSQPPPVGHPDIGQPPPPAQGHPLGLGQPPFNQPPPNQMMFGQGGPGQSRFPQPPLGQPPPNQKLTQDSRNRSDGMPNAPVGFPGIQGDFRDPQQQHQGMGNVWPMGMQSSIPPPGTDSKLGSDSGLHGPGIRPLGGMGGGTGQPLQQQGVRPFGGMGGPPGLPSQQQQQQQPGIRPLGMTGGPPGQTTSGIRPQGGVSIPPSQQGIKPLMCFEGLDGSQSGGQRWMGEGSNDERKGGRGPDRQQYDDKQERGFGRGADNRSDRHDYRDRDQRGGRDRGREHDRGRDRDRDQGRDRDGGRDRGGRDIDFGRDRDMRRDRDMGRDRDRDMGRDRDAGRDRGMGRDRDLGRNRDPGRDRELGRDREFGRDRDRDQSRDKDRDRDRGRERDSSEADHSRDSSDFGGRRDDRPSKRSRWDPSPEPEKLSLPSLMSQPVCLPTPAATNNQPGILGEPPSGMRPLVGASSRDKFPGGFGSPVGVDPQQTSILGPPPPGGPTLSVASMPVPGTGSAPSIPSLMAQPIAPPKFDVSKGIPPSVPKSLTPSPLKSSSDQDASHDQPPSQSQMQEKNIAQPPTVVQRPLSALQSHNVPASESSQMQASGGIDAANIKLEDIAGQDKPEEQHGEVPPFGRGRGGMLPRGGPGGPGFIGPPRGPPPPPPAMRGRPGLAGGPGMPFGGPQRGMRPPPPNFGASRPPPMGMRLMPQGPPLRGPLGGGPAGPGPMPRWQRQGPRLFR